MLHQPVMGTWGPNFIAKVKFHAWCGSSEKLSHWMWADLSDCRCSSARDFRKRTEEEKGDEQLKLWEELSTRTLAATLKYNASSLGRWDVCQSVDCGFWDTIFPWCVRICVWSSFKTFLFPHTPPPICFCLLVWFGLGFLWVGCFFFFPLFSFSWRRLPAVLSPGAEWGLSSNCSVRIVSDHWTS